MCYPKTMIGAITTALSGLTAATKKAEDASLNIANASSVNSNGTPIDQVDLSEEAVNLMIAETEYKANTAVIRTTADMQDALLDSVISD